MVEAGLIHLLALHLPEMGGVRYFSPALFLPSDWVVAKTLDQVGLGEGVHTVRVAVDAVLALCAAGQVL